MDKDHTHNKEDLKKVPVFRIDQICKKDPVPYKHFTISISEEYICNFCLEIGTLLENPLLPNGTIALFKNLKDFRFLRNGDVVIILKENKAFLSYFKFFSNKRYLVSLNNLQKEEILDDKIILIAKMVYAIMKHVPASYLNFGLD